MNMPHTRRTRIRRWFYAHIPLWFVANSFEIFLSLLCFLGGIPLLLGQIESNSLESQLPRALVIVWGAILTVCPIAVNVGIWQSWKEVSVADFIFWSRIEAWGLSALAYAAYIYGGIVATQHPKTGALVALIIIIFGMSCHSKELDLQLKIVDLRLEIGLNATRE